MFNLSKKESQKGIESSSGSVSRYLYSIIALKERIPKGNWKAYSCVYIDKLSWVSGSQRKNPKRELKVLFVLMLRVTRTDILSKKESQKGIESSSGSVSRYLYSIIALKERIPKGNWKAYSCVYIDKLSWVSGSQRKNPKRELKVLFVLMLRVTRTDILSKKESQKGIERVRLIEVCIKMNEMTSQRKNPKRELKAIYSCKCILGDLPSTLKERIPKGNWKPIP